jgi:hypothetical protein
VIAAPAVANHAVVMHRYAQTLQDMGAVVQATRVASEVAVAQQRGDLLLSYMRSKAPATLTATTLAATLSQAWQVLHLHATRGTPEDAAARLAQYWQAAPAPQAAGLDAAAHDLVSRFFV